MSDVVWFEDERCTDVRLAGGKGASLAAMTAAGLPVPPGFVVPAHALGAAVDGARLREHARAQECGRAQALVRSAAPPRLAIAGAYERLGAGPVAVRSSACSEDSEAASFAGQQETYLNVLGAGEVCSRVVECWASFFAERALFYRARKGSLDDLEMAVVVQRMVWADVAGVLFTCDPVHHRHDRMVVEAVLWPGETAVSREGTPDPHARKR